MDMSDQGDAPATKGDIQTLLSTLATKEDLQSFATKDDLNDLARKSALNSVKTNSRIDQLREDLRGEMSLMTSGVFKKIDGFLSKTGKIDRAQVIADWRVAQMEKRVEAIESRPS